MERIEMQAAGQNGPKKEYGMWEKFGSPCWIEHSGAVVTCRADVVWVHGFNRMCGFCTNPKREEKKLWYLKTRIPTFFSVSTDENGFSSAACLGLCVSVSVCDNYEVCKCGCVWISECLSMAAGKQAESRRFEPYMLPDPLSSWWLQRNCHLTSQRQFFFQSCNISIIRSYFALQLLPEKKQC